MKKYCLFFLLLYGAALQAQPEALFFHKLTQREGLLEGWNWYVGKDSRGFVWVSSIYGLNRFDGVNVRVFTPDHPEACPLFGHNIQSRFFEDVNADIWFCTYEAIHRYRRKDDCFDYFFLEKEGQPIQAGYYVFALDGAGRLWFLLNQREIWTFDTRAKRFEKQDEGRASRCHARLNAAGEVDLTAAYWLGDPGVLLTAYGPAGQQEKKMLFDGRQPAGLPPLKVRHGHFQGERCWFATDIGLIEYHVPTGSYNLYDQFDGQKIEIIGYVGPYDDESLVLTSNKGYLLFFDINERRFVRRFEHREGEIGSLRRSGFGNAYVDAQRNIWVSMMRDGLDWSSPGKARFEVISPFPPASGDILKLEPAEDGSWWCATRQEAWQLDLSSAREPAALRRTAPPEGYGLKEIAADRGALWALNFNDLWHYTPAGDTWQHVQAVSDQRKDYFNQLLPLRQGGVLVLTYKGVKQFVANGDAAFARQELTALDSVASYAGAFQDSRGRLFIGKNQEGIALLEDRGNGWDSIGWLPIRGEPNCWHEDLLANTLWIGTSLGLVELKLTDFSFRTYARKDGLPDYHIFSLVADAAGRLWMGTNNGLARFDPATGQVRSFSRADGLPEENFTPGLARRLPNGALLFGCGPKLLLVPPDEQKAVLPPPVVQITSLRVNDEASPYLRCESSGASNPEEFLRLKLPYRQNTLSFGFVAIEYGDPARNRTRYKLEGYDEKWQDGLNPGFVRYPNLPPGNYRLLLLAANSNDDWTDQPKVLEIAILPPWWQAGWFRLASLALLFLITLGLYRYRIAQMERLQQMRNQIAADLHDEVGSSITGIRMFSDVVRMELSEDRPELVPPLERIGNSASKIMDSIRDIVWAINPATDRLVDLVDRMREAAAACEAAGLTHGFAAPALPEQLRINPKAKHNLLLIFKEALNNALKYAGATHIEIIIQLEGKILSLKIRDNGQGFDPGAVARGNGLYNMERRAAAMNAKLSLESRPAYGTVVAVSVRI
jgi:signal transduction histidine kinase/ligand-binding sensor domain-containing protein